VDGVLLWLTVGLMGLGLVMVYSASIHVANSSYHDGAHYLERQMVSAGLGLAGLVVGLLMPYRALRAYVRPLLVISLLLLVVVLIPGIGTTAGKATRWIRFPGFSFQPSELAKIAFVVWIAHSLERKATQIRTFSMGLLPHLMVCGLFILLCLAQPDLGVCIVLSLVMVAMLFAAGTRMSYLVALFLVAAPLLVSAIANNDMRMRRILAFLDPWEHRYDTAYALVNGMAAMGSGGLTGQGLGAGMQKFGYIPEAQTDFIFPVIGEELGFVGCALVIAAFVGILWRGWRIAVAATDDFGRHLAYGITMLIGVQAAINIGVSLALLPTKGLTLPLISFGGTSLVLSAFQIGVLLRISAESQPTEAPANSREGYEAARVDAQEGWA
jgi:cell division protein FtsW